MLTYPFPATTVEVYIPAKFRSWFSKAESISVKLHADTAVVDDKSSYRLHPLADGRYAVLRPDGPPALRVVGEFDAKRVRHTLNNRFSREINVIRSAVYGLSFPAPVAYVLRDHSLVHPGPCFEEHADVVTLKALYTIKKDDARCCVCQEPFL